MDAVIIQLGVGVGLQNVIGWFPPLVLGIANVVPILLAVYYYADKSLEWRNHEEVEDELSYDFIVVGGGSAGSVVANRLSKYFSVLLLERGGNPNPLTSVPGMEAVMMSRPEVDYRYLTVPQNASCLACNNRQSLWNSGHGLGGSSILNAMAYIRGHPYDYDLWAHFTRDKRWKYDNILPYYLRTEGYCGACESQGVRPTIHPNFHSMTGELPVQAAPLTPMVPEFLEALAWASVPKGDYNAPFYKPIGDVVLYTQRNGRRVTSANAFIDPILKTRSNIKVLKYARVTRVIFHSGTNQVSGVEYEAYGKIFRVKASKEVVLSAGAIASPKILLLSGIGPQEDLSQLNIPVRASLPVGRNLQDHVGTIIGPFLINQPISIIPERDMTPEAARIFLENGTGPFSITFPRAVTLWTSSRAIQSGEGNWPDIQIGMSSNGVSQTMDQVLSQLYNLRLDVMKEFLDPIKGRDAFFLIVDYARPRSRGVLRLASANYVNEPLIDPRYYTDANDEDIKVTVEAALRALHLAENAPVYKRLGSRLSPVPFPTCKHVLFRSPQYWECVARQFTLTLHHFSGTAAMGPLHSPDSVVDSELKVIGIKGLRVIDASVMPILISTNTNAASMMIAERGSDFIIDSWGGRTNEDLIEDNYDHDYKK